MPEVELFGRTFRSPVPLPPGYLLAPTLALAVIAGVLAGPNRRDTEDLEDLIRNAETRLHEAIAEADRDMPRGWRLDAIRGGRRDVPDDRNAARVVESAYALLPDDWLTKHQAVGDIRPDSRTSQRPGASAMDHPLPEPLVSDQLAAIIAELEPLAPALAEARTLAGMTEGRFAVEEAPLDSDTPLPHLARVRLVAHLLALDALARANSGEVDAAVLSCRAMLGAARSIGDEPRVASQRERMVVAMQAARVLERVLACGEASDDSLGTIQHELDDEQAEPWLVRGLRGDRAHYAAMLDRLISGEATMTDPDDGPTLPRPQDLDEPRRADLIAFYRGHEARVLSQMNEAVAIAQLPAERQDQRWSEFFSEVAATPLGLKSLPSNLSDFDRPQVVLTLHHAARESLLARAQLACAVLGIACERQRLAHGELPRSSKAIDPAILDEPPPDPFARGPVRLAIVEGGVEASSQPPPLDAAGLVLPKPDPLRFRVLEPAQRRHASNR